MTAAPSASREFDSPGGNSSAAHTAVANAPTASTGEFDSPAADNAAADTVTTNAHTISTSEFDSPAGNNTAAHTEMTNAHTISAVDRIAMRPRVPPARIRTGQGSRRVHRPMPGAGQR